MVALAVSRGNLHKVPNAPRRWPLPPRSISLPQFKNLLRRRALALSRIAAAAADENPSSTSPCTEKKVKEEEAEESPEKAVNPAIGGAAAKNGEDEPAPDGKAVKEDAADSKLEVRPKICSVNGVAGLFACMNILIVGFDRWKIGSNI